MLSSLLFGLAMVLRVFLEMLMMVVIASALISWVSADPRNPIVNMIYSLTEPLYSPIRRYTSRLGGPIDLAPLAVAFIIMFLQQSVPRYLMMLSQQMQ